MKKSIIYLLTIGLLALVVISCSKKSNDADPLAERGLEKQFMGSFLPDMFDVQKGNVANVRLLPSSARYTLDLSLPNAEKYGKILKEGIENGVPVEVYVYEKTNEIAEVKPASEQALAKFSANKGESAPSTKENLPIIPNEASLNSLFSACSTSSISYNYAGDGCYARAHRMRQIILNSGYDCAKQFIYGNLSARSVSGCCANWSYHVAPLVRFRDSNGQIQLRILDPSLFNHPVTQAEWFAACKNSTCASGTSQSGTRLTAGNVYYTSQNGSYTAYDDNYSKTTCAINHYINYTGCWGAPAASCSI